MNDRDLLQLAAKNAGMELPEYWSWGLSKGSATYWDPLEDSVQAFHLAVKLQLKVRYHETLGQALVWTIWDDEFQVNVEDCGNDRYKATRRAIVLATAGIKV